MEAKPIPEAQVKALCDKVLKKKKNLFFIFLPGKRNFDGREQRAACKITSNNLRRHPRAIL